MSFLLGNPSEIQFSPKDMLRQLWCHYLDNGKLQPVSGNEAILQFNVEMKLPGEMLTREEYALFRSHLLEKYRDRLSTREYYQIDAIRNYSGIEFTISKIVKPSLDPAKAIVPKELINMLLPSITMTKEHVSLAHRLLQFDFDNETRKMESFLENNKIVAVLVKEPDPNYFWLTKRICKYIPFFGSTKYFIINDHADIGFQQLSAVDLFKKLSGDTLHGTEELCIQKIERNLSSENSQVLVIGVDNSIRPQLIDEIVNNFWIKLKNKFERKGLQAYLVLILSFRHNTDKIFKEFEEKLSIGGCQLLTLETGGILGRVGISKIYPENNYPIATKSSYTPKGSYP